MLVLSRKENEAIHIDGNIQIRVLSIGANSVKIGIEAPREILISREELLTRVKEENIDTASSQKQIESKTSEILSKLKAQLFS